MYFIERLWAVADGQFGRAARGCIEKYTGTELSYTHQQDFNMSAYQDLARSRSRALWSTTINLSRRRPQTISTSLYTISSCYVYVHV